MIRHEHVTGNVLGYLGMKRCHPSKGATHEAPRKTTSVEMCTWHPCTHARVWLSNGATLRNNVDVYMVYCVGYHGQGYITISDKSFVRSYL